MDFVKEGKVEEEKKRRQAEWERVRKQEDPIEAPPEVFDNRTLYEKLKEQHDMKKKEFEDQYALKNQIKGIDEDEAQFLTEIDRARLKREKELRLEEKKELEEVKIAKNALSSISSDIPKITLTLPSHKKENKQAELLSNIVVNKRKSAGSTSTTTSTSTLISSTDASFNKVAGSDSDSDSDNENKRKKTKQDKSKQVHQNQIVLGILPGIGEYDSNSSSVSEESTDDDEDDCDIDTSAILARQSGENSAAAKLNK